MKKIARAIIVLHMCTKNQDHTMYASWDMEHDIIFSYFVPFFALLPPAPKYTINHDHMLYCSLDMACDRWNYYF